MRIIGVIDILSGQVVAARAGNRDQYQPIQTRLCEGSDPATVAKALADQCGVHAIYLADIDRLSASRNAQPPVSPAAKLDNRAAWQAVANTTDQLWLDAGIRDPKDLTFVQQVLQNQGGNNVRLICATESWSSPNLKLPHRELEELVFGIDLRCGVIATALPRWQSLPALEIAKELIESGWSRFVVLDVSAVGVAQGCPTVELCRSLRQISDDIEIVTGGGVRNTDDLSRLEDAGCDAVLLSTALHNGSI